MSSSWHQGYPPAQPPYPPHYQPYPPQQPHPGYPMQGYQQYPPPQHYQQPAQPPPNPNAPQNQARPTGPGKQNKPSLLRVLVALVIIVTLVGGYFAFFQMRSDPQVGDCLSSMDFHFVGGMDVVDCNGPEAAYEIVNRTGSRDEPACSGHDNGESYEYYGGRRNRFQWAVCGVPTA